LRELVVPKEKKRVQPPVTIGIDLGTGSMAILARRDQEVLWHKTVLLVADTASLVVRRGKRRMIRTRLAHRAREYWWNQCAIELGITTLKTVTRINAETYKISAVDDHLKREHPGKSDPDTCFNGALLRIKIIEGHVTELEPWQIYKAVHAAIQKRGYDHDVPWASGYSDSETDENHSPEGKTIRESIGQFEEFLKSNIPSIDHHLPCYFEALKSGLWNQERGILSNRQDHNAEQRGMVDYKGYIAPRRMVDREISLILKAVKSRYPKLNVDYVMYGPSLVPYGSHPRHHHRVLAKSGRTDLHGGRESDWQGVLGQKLPRFDNRILSPCALIPRFKAAKIPSTLSLKDMPASDREDPREIRLYPKFVLMMALKNLRVLKTPDGSAEALTPEEFRDVFAKMSAKLTYGKRDLKSALESLGFSLAPGAQEELKFRRSGSGRSAHSKPALRMVTALLLNGWSAAEAHAHFARDLVRGNTDPLRGLILADLAWLDQLKATSWQGFYLPQMRQRSNSAGGTNVDVDAFIHSITHPVVRHRLGLLHKSLKAMINHLAARGISLDDARIGLEVIGDSGTQSFLGEVAKTQMNFRMASNKKDNEAVQALCDEWGLTGRKNFERVKLARRQGFCDPYDIVSRGTENSANDLKSMMMSGIQSGIYDVDHIVPEALGGPDELYNKVLTRKETNRFQKGNLTPHQWLHQSGRWGAYLDLVIQMPDKTGDRPGLSKLTKRLLNSPDAESLVNKKTDLQATGYIEKSAQNVIYGTFGWSLPMDGGVGTRHVVCVPGGMTARYRRMVKLDPLLYPQADDAGPAQADARRKKLKNRENPKHHILDAAVLTFIPEWALDRNKNKFFRLPEFATPTWFQETVIQPHQPEHYNALKPGVRETKKSITADQKLVAVKKHLLPSGSPSVEWNLSKLVAALAGNKFNHPPGSESVSPLTTALRGVITEDLKKLPGAITVQLGAHKVRVKSLKEYGVYGPDQHLILSDKGVIESHPHKGVMIWRVKGEKTWSCGVVASWGSSQGVRNRIVVQHPNAEIEFWNGGRPLLRGDRVEILRAYKAAAPGIYTVDSAWDTGVIKLEGLDFLPSITPLIKKGGLRVLKSSAR